MKEDCSESADHEKSETAKYERSEKKSEKKSKRSGKTQVTPGAWNTKSK